MADLIQYNPTGLWREPHASLPGVSALKYLGRFFSIGLAPLDRTGTLLLPTKLKCVMPMPAYTPFTKTYEDLCNARAQELLAHADSLDTKLYVFWSGGIDSTLVLVSFLKFASPEQRRRIVVLMTEESIAENPLFYRDHIYGKLATDSAMQLPYLFGDGAIMTHGEQNDQLMGFDAVGAMMMAFGNDIIHKPYSHDVLLKFFMRKVDNESVVRRYLDLFDTLMAGAPIPIRTHLEYLWWINFALKYQNAALRMLTCVPKRFAPLMTPEYTKDHYVSFYGTDDFQLWSMNNTDKRIKDEWRTYKWVAKDIIYDFTKDADYRDNKTKRGSLRSVILQQHTFNFIDENMQFFDDVDPATYYVPNNDLVGID